MTDFDARAYERDRWREATEAGRRLLALLEERAIDPERASLIRLDCPRGHKLDRYRLDTWEHDGGLQLNLRPVAEVAASGDVARRNEPFREGRHVCHEAGCGSLLNHEGYCDAHGGRRVQTVADMRTEWTCRLATCRWHGPVTRAQLLRVYGTGLMLEVDRIPVTGVSAAPRPNRRAPRP